MKQRTTYILFIALVGMVGAVVVMQLVGSRPVAGSLVFPGMRELKVEENDITVVQIDRAGAPNEKMVFERPSAAAPWRMVRPIPCRAETLVIDQLVRDLVRLKLDAATEDLPRDLKGNGLDPPGLTITLAKADGRTWTLGFGNESLGSINKRIVSVVSSDRPKEPLAVGYQYLEAALRDAKDFRDKSLVLATHPSASAVTLSDGKRDISLVKAGSADPPPWRFVKPELGDADYQTEGPPSAPETSRRAISSVYHLLATIEQLRVGYDPRQGVDDFVADNVSDADLATKYGLAERKPATLRIEVKFEGGGARANLPDVLLIGNRVRAAPQERTQPTPDEKPGEPSMEDGRYYARLESEKSVFQVPARGIQPMLDLLKNPTVLRNKNLVALDANRVDAIDVKNATGTIKLRKVGEPAVWKVSENGTFREADVTAVAMLLSALIARRQVREFPTQPDAVLGLDDASSPVRVSIWQDGIASKKDAKPDVRLSEATVKLVVAAKPDKDIVYARRERSTDVVRVAVSARLLAKLSERRLTYFARKLPLFTADDEATRIVISRPMETIELDWVKDKPDDRLGYWKLAKPAEQAGRRADGLKVGHIVETLRRLQPQRLIAEKADERDLREFGLAPAAYRVAVTVKKGDGAEDHVFLFGTETEKKDGRYAKQGEHDLVFLVRPDVIEPLKAKALVDPQVFKFDIARLRGIQLIGWQAVEKRVITLDVKLVKPAGGGPRVWAVKNDLEMGGFRLDGRRITDLAVKVSRLRADRFLVFGRGPAPDHKLAENDRALEIRFFLEGESKPLTLTIGAPVQEGDQKGYAAQSSELPGDVFVVPEARFEQMLKEGPKYFSK